MERCNASELDGNAVAAAGAALATLHEQHPPELSSWTREAEAADLLSLASEIGFIYPQLARRADDPARRLASQLAGLPAARCALHGDFSANQVLVGEKNVAIIELDCACYGDAAEDLVNFLAQAERCALRGELPSPRVE